MSKHVRRSGSVRNARPSRGSTGRCTTRGWRRKGEPWYVNRRKVAEQETAAAGHVEIAKESHSTDVQRLAQLESLGRQHEQECIRKQLNERY